MLLTATGERNAKRDDALALCEGYWDAEVDAESGACD